MGAEGEGKAPTVYIETLLVVRPIKVVGLMCGIIAVLLLMLSIAATSWLHAERTREGLWERCVYNVTNSDYLDECKLADNSRDWVVACQALCLMSLITCIIAIIITSLALTNTNFKVKYKLYWAGLVAFLIAVLFELVSLIIFPVKFLDEISSRDETTWRFGWAYIVGWIGAVAEFAAGLFLLLDKGAEEIIYRERVLHEENGIEASEDV